MRIDKRQARKLFNEHKSFWMSASNMRKECGILFGRTSAWFNQFTSFDALCNNFMYYNCDNERGRYIKFYTDD